MKLLKENEKDFIKKSLKVSHFEVERLSGDVSTRKYFRIHFKNKTAVFVRSQPHSVKNFVEIAQYLKKFKIPTPKIVNFSDEDGFNLIEDGGDTLLESVIAKSPKNLLPLYKKIMTSLVTLQTEATKSKAFCSAKKVAFTQEKFFEELLFMEENLFKSYLHQSYDSSTLHKEFEKLATILANLAYCFTHRDFHSRNILITNKKPMFLDFQDARLGPFQYDVTSFLRDSYVLLPDSIQTKLLNYYFECHKKKHSKLNKEEFIKYYDYVTLQRSLKASGTFASVWVKKKNDFYLKYLPHTFVHVKSALKKIGKEFPMIQKIVEEVKL